MRFFGFMRDPVLQIGLVIGAILFVAHWLVAVKQYIDTNQVSISEPTWVPLDPNWEKARTAQPRHGKGR